MYPCGFEAGAVCIDFVLPHENLYQYSYSTNQFEAAFSSLFMWLNLRLTVPSRRNNPNITVKMKIQNKKSPKGASIEEYLKSGWNLINIEKLFSPETSSNASVCTVIVRPSRSQYTVDIQSSEVNMYRAHVYVQSYGDRKPIVIIDQSDDGSENPSKSRTHRKRSLSKSGNRTISIDEIDAAASAEALEPNMCPNKSSDAECCLASYYVTFIQLKWAKWVISPTGYKANFCIGKCSPFNSKLSELFLRYFWDYSQSFFNRFEDFANSSKNAQIKNIYNQNNVGRSGSLSQKLSTCCHPTKMKSLTIRYLTGNGTAITTVLPNMIVTECGCS